jgi:ABC-2 type transport system permease protein
MLVRNRLVLVSSVLLPLAFGAYFVSTGVRAGTAGYAAACIVVGLAAMGTYTVATTTLAARRQTSLLQRLRSSAVGDASILLGITAPIVILNMGQVTIVLLALRIATRQTVPHPWLLMFSVLVSQMMFVSFALATAGVTGSPEAAQYTCLPLLLGSVLAAICALMGQSAVAAWLPGGGLARLASASWAVGDLSDVLWLVFPTLTWAAAAVVAARVLFRWDVRSLSASTFRFDKVDYRPSRRCRDGN